MLKKQASESESYLNDALKAGMDTTLADANLFAKYSAAVFAAHRMCKDLHEPYHKLMGTRESYPRPPHFDATSGQRAQIKTKMKELGLTA